MSKVHDERAAGYTPGPWVVDDDGFIYDGQALHEKPICDPRCFDPRAEGAQAEMDANARLIAAAPDLAAALKAALPMLGAHAATGCDCPDSEAYRMARAALAKAGVA